MGVLPSMTQDLNPSDPKDAPQTDFEGDAAELIAAAEADYNFTDEHIKAIRQALEAEDLDSAAALIDELNEADIAELLTKVEEEERTELIARFARSFPPETYLYLSGEIRENVLEQMGASEVAQVVAELESDDALELLVDLDPVFQKDIIRKLSAKDRATVEEGLQYPEESAGRIMQREFVAVPQFWTVGKVIDYLRASSEDDMPEEFLDIFLIDAKYHVVGEIPLHRLVRAQRTEQVDILITEDLVKIPADMDQEEVARIFRRTGLSTAPVVDDVGRMLGVITIDDVADVIEEEAAEDIMRLGGVGAEDTTSDIAETTRSRFTWLLVNLFTAILASMVVGMFEKEIAAIVALAVLMPIVAGMGGNAGTQTLTVAVRALATRELSRTNALRMVKKEVLVGLINGVLFALIVGGYTLYQFQDPGLAMVMGLAMIINLFAAGFCGIAIPLILNVLRLDPALSSAVWLTTVTDVVGFFAFLGLASWILL